MYIITYLPAGEKKEEIIYRNTNFMEAINELEHFALDTIYNKQGSAHFYQKDKFYVFKESKPKKPIIKDRGHYAVVEHFKSFVYYKNKNGYLYSGSCDLVCTFELLHVRAPIILEKRISQMDSESKEDFDLSVTAIKALGLEKLKEEEEN